MRPQPKAPEAGHSSKGRSIRSTEAVHCGTPGGTHQQQVEEHSSSPSSQVLPHLLRGINETMASDVNTISMTVALLLY